jgi:hypothetical protein
MGPPPALFFACLHIYGYTGKSVKSDPAHDKCEFERKIFYTFEIPLSIRARGLSDLPAKKALIYAFMSGE